MNDIKAAFAEHGLDPGSVVLDGKVHRFKVEKDDAKHSGWYVGFQNHTRKSGEVFQVVVYGNFRTSETFTFQTGGVSFSAEDHRAIKQQIATAKKLEEALRSRAQEEVAESVAKSWAALLSDGSSEYLRKKLLPDDPGLGMKYDDKGSIYVPARDADGRIWSWQQIGWDGQKWFHPGGRIRGCSHVIGNLAGADRVFICEGFATAGSIRIATGEPVVVAFTSANLVDVAADFKKRHPAISIIVCGDDDRWKDPTRNPGREKADEAAKAGLGTAVIPVFAIDAGNPTDFNDLHVREGIDAVRVQLGAVKEKPQLALYALGFNEGEYYFTSTSNRQIVRVTAFSEDSLLKLMPLEYWEAVFPGDKSGVSWSRAKSDLMSQCRARGIFNLDNVRGAGVWEDHGRVIVNMGNHLIVDGVKKELGSIATKYFYTLGENLEHLRDNPLSAKECEVLVKACQLFKWARPAEAGILLAGGLVCARVCGALPVRPHIWLTGGAQTGKTTLQSKLVDPILGSNKLYVLGGTSEAGVRQGLKYNAVPVLFDEFETNGPKSAEHIAACIELMRAAWSNSGGMIVKGGQSGNAMHFQVRFSAIVSSIRTRLINDADKGRFATLELAPHGSDEKHWQELSGLLAQIDGEYSERLFARTIKMLPTLLANFKKIKIALAKRADSRFGDQYGMLLAGYSILVFDDAITDVDAEFLAENIELIDEKEVAKQADHQDALMHLLSTKISYEGPNARREKLIGELIASVVKSQRSVMPGMDQAERNALLGLGIRVESDFVAVVISNHAELERRVWSGTKWSNIWGNSLTRLSGATKKKTRIGGLGARVAVQIPISQFDVE